MKKDTDFTNAMAIPKRTPKPEQPVVAPVASVEPVADTTPSKPKNPRAQPNKKHYTLNLDRDLMGKVQAIAYWRREDTQRVITDALQMIVDKYEKENGKVEPIPER